MKFAHEFKEILTEAEFPSHWVQSAISYPELKKCIKKLQNELLELGLDAHTLKELLAPVETKEGLPSPRDDKLPILQYSFVGNKESPHPQLSIIVDTRDGHLIDVGLSQETKEYLRRIVSLQASSKANAGKTTEDRFRSDIDQNHGEPTPIPVDLDQGTLEPSSSSTELVLADRRIRSGNNAIEPPVEIRSVKIPLKFDSEFFGLLEHDLSGVDSLQEQEQQKMTGEVLELGKTVSRAAAPSTPSTDISRWRAIFELYLQAKVFFSTDEQDHGVRSAATAAKQLNWFSEEASKLGLGKAFKTKESRTALDQFMQLNFRLLQNLKYQEINQTATYKILKKFDKRTALSVKTKFSDYVAGRPFLAGTLAKAVCFKLAQEVISTVPQLNDYLCPVCFNIAFKPIRLKCGHFFCIRCMIVMQRTEDKHCPLCRGDVVMEADEANLDPALMNFLKRYFPKEVKMKQKENERAVAVDRWGQDYDKCTVM